MQIIHPDGKFLISGTMDNTDGLTLIAQSKVSNQVVALSGFTLAVDGATPWSVAETVTIKDTAGNIFATIAVSALTANALINERSPGVTLGRAWFNCGAANHGLLIAPDVAGTGSSIVVRVDGFITAIPSGLLALAPQPANPADLYPSIATQEEAEAGSDNTKMMTPLRALQSITEQIGVFGDIVHSNIADFATAAQGSKVDAAAAITALGTTISDPPTQSEVQAIVDKLDTLIEAFD
jgi:hypothetical protein